MKRSEKRDPKLVKVAFMQYMKDNGRNPLTIFILEGGGKIGCYTSPAGEMLSKFCDENKIWHNDRSGIINELFGVNSKSEKLRKAYAEQEGKVEPEEAPVEHTPPEREDVLSMFKAISEDILRTENLIKGMRYHIEMLGGDDPVGIDRERLRATYVNNMSRDIVCFIEALRQDYKQLFIEAFCAGDSSVHEEAVKLAEDRTSKKLINHSIRKFLDENKYDGPKQRKA